MLIRVKHSVQKVAEVSCQKYITGNEQLIMAVLPLFAAFVILINGSLV